MGDEVGRKRDQGAFRLRTVLVPALMVAVAAVGTWRYHHQDQTSWRGATMGMFAMVDAPANRLVRGVVEGTPGDEGASTVILPPPQLNELRTRALVTPTDANLRRLAERWQSDLDSRLVRVEVWATRFRAGAGGPAVRLELIATFDPADMAGTSGR